MQRHENESFVDYKIRRATSNAAVKRINERAKSGGTTGSREIARRERDNSKHAGAYGRDLAAAAAQKRATPQRLSTHTAYVERMQSRKAARTLA